MVGILTILILRPFSAMISPVRRSTRSSGRRIYRYNFLLSQNRWKIVEFSVQPNKIRSTLLSLENDRKVLPKGLSINKLFHVTEITKFHVFSVNATFPRMLFLCFQKVNISQFMVKFGRIFKLFESQNVTYFFDTKSRVKSSFENLDFVCLMDTKLCQYWQKIRANL